MPENQISNAFLLEEVKNLEAGLARHRANAERLGTARCPCRRCQLLGAELEWLNRPALPTASQRKRAWREAMDARKAAKLEASKWGHGLVHFVFHHNSPCGVQPGSISPYGAEPEGSDDINSVTCDHCKANLRVFLAGALAFTLHRLQEQIEWTSGDVASITALLERAR